MSYSLEELKAEKARRSQSYSLEELKAEKARREAAAPADSESLLSYKEDISSLDPSRNAELLKYSENTLPDISSLAKENRKNPLDMTSEVMDFGSSAIQSLMQMGEGGAKLAGATDLAKGINENRNALKAGTESLQKNLYPGETNSFAKLAGNVAPYLLTGLIGGSVMAGLETAGSGKPDEAYLDTLGKASKGTVGASVLTSGMDVASGLAKNFLSNTLTKSTDPLEEAGKKIEDSLPLNLYHRLQTAHERLTKNKNPQPLDFINAGFKRSDIQNAPIEVQAQLEVLSKIYNTAGKKDVLGDLSSIPGVGKALDFLSGKPNKIKEFNNKAYEFITNPVIQKEFTKMVRSGQSLDDIVVGTMDLIDQIKLPPKTKSSKALTGTQQLGNALVGNISGDN